jgi:hypothetical protein
VSELHTGDALTWTQEDIALPMPLDPKDPALALALKASDFNRTLNRQTLAVNGLTRARYVLRIDGEFAGSFSRQDLAEGVDLGAMPTPMAKQALEVHALTLKRAAIHNARWRQVQVPMQDTKAGRLQAALDSLDALEAELVEQQRAAAQPKPRRYELTPE